MIQFVTVTSFTFLLLIGIPLLIIGVLGSVLPADFLISTKKVENEEIAEKITKEVEIIKTLQ